MALRLAGCTFGYLHLTSLDDALADLADHGLTTCELTCAPPHVNLSAPGALADVFARRGMRCISVNPSYADLNLVSTIPEFRELSLGLLERTIELAADVGAPYVVVVPGRLHALQPAPRQVVDDYLRAALERLLYHAERHGVTLALENTPYRFISTAAELQGVAALFDHPRLRLCYDVANSPPGEDVPDALATLGDRLGLAHVSDTRRDRWLHTSPGRGEVNFGAFAAGLISSGFGGFTVYELADGEDPSTRLEADLARLVSEGWMVT